MASSTGQFPIYLFVPSLLRDSENEEFAGGNQLTIYKLWTPDNGEQIQQGAREELESGTPGLRVRCARWPLGHAASSWNVESYSVACGNPCTLIVLKDIYFIEEIDLKI